MVTTVSELARVEFHGDTLEAVRDDRGVWVSIRRVCDALGIDLSSQLAKLKTKPWAVMAMNTMTAEDGKRYEVATLHLDGLPMWLATIEPSRVAVHVREKLGQYQCECARVLRNHFFGPSTTGDALLDECHLLQRMASALVDVRQEQIAVKQEVAAARGIAEGADVKAEAAQATATLALRALESGQGYATIEGFARRQGIPMTRADAQAHGRNLTLLCRKRGVVIREVDDEERNKVHSYPEGVVAEYFDQVMGAATR